MKTAERFHGLFHALGDPTRLKMVERLSTGRSLTINYLTGGLKISRQGARKHLQILTDAKIIILSPNGRETLVNLDFEVLDKGREFILRLERDWEKRLEALQEFVDKG